PTRQGRLSSRRSVEGDLPAVATRHASSIAVQDAAHANRGGIQATVRNRSARVQRGPETFRARATSTIAPRLQNGGDTMRTTLTAVAAAATIAVATVATPSTADARWGWWGPVLGGFAAGAIIGGALAGPYYYGGYYPAYSYSPAYGYPAYGYSYAPAYY